MIESILRFIVDSVIGIGSGLISGLYALKVMKLDTNKNEDIIVYWMFILVVGYALVYIMRTTIY